MTKAVHSLSRVHADECGNIAVMMAFLLPILCGVLGVGFEITNWYMQTRAMQNAADSAALAAAANRSASYNVEATAVAAQFGYVSGINNVTVTALNNVTCPDGNTTCYKVQITSKVPLYLSQVVGYTGDATVNGRPAKAVSSTAIAERKPVPQVVCLLALDPVGPAFTANGSPKTDFTGCTLMSNGNATCNGSNLNANLGIAVGTNGGGAGCGIDEISNYPQPLADPYSQILKNDTGMSATALSKCSGSPPYPQWSKKSGYPTTITSLSNFKTFMDSDGNKVYVACGDTQLGGNISFPAGQNSVLVVENGMLDLGGYTLTGSALSLVFSGTAGGPYNHIVTGNGTLNFSGPTSGNWSGVALYQDPILTTGVDISYAGNNPAWYITGLIYLPNSSVTLSGAINKAGADCLVTVVKDMTVNGSGSVYSQTPDGSGCKSAKLIQPTVTLWGRSQLVY